MLRKIGSNTYLRGVLIANGIGDILLALVMIFLPGRLAALLGFPGLEEIFYLSGGWGIAALSFGFLRLFAGLHADIKIGWFTAVFGLLEGGALTSFGVVTSLTTSLTWGRVSLSTGFAFLFGLGYALAFILRRRDSRKQETGRSPS